MSIFKRKKKTELDPFHKDHPRNKKSKNSFIKDQSRLVNDDDIHTFTHNTKHPIKSQITQL